MLLLRFITRVCNVAFGLFEMRLDCCCACFFCEGRSCRGSSLVRLVQGSYGLHERRTTAVIMMVMVMVMLQGAQSKAPAAPTETIEFRVVRHRKPLMNRLATKVLEGLSRFYWLLQTFMHLRQGNLGLVFLHQGFQAGLPGDANPVSLPTALASRQNLQQQSRRRVRKPPRTSALGRHVVACRFGQWTKTTFCFRALLYYTV